MTEKELQLHQKREVKQAGESTKQEKYYVPAVDIYEFDDAVRILAEMPGISREGVEIDLEDDTLTIRGTVSAGEREGERMLFEEFRQGNYLRKFTITELIDQENIRASMVDGLLTLVLPKVAPAKPRRIEVQAG